LKGADDLLSCEILRGGVGLKVSARCLQWLGGLPKKASTAEDVDMIKPDLARRR